MKFFILVNLVLLSGFISVDGRSIFSALNATVHQVSIGDSLALKCDHIEQAGNFTRLDWLFQGSIPHHIKLPTATEFRNGTLAIDSITTEHAGQYLCTVEFENGSKEYTLHQVNIRPRVEVVGIFKCSNQTVTLSLVVAKSEDFEKSIKEKQPHLNQCKLLNSTVIRTIRTDGEERVEPKNLDSPVTYGQVEKILDQLKSINASLAKISSSSSNLPVKNVSRLDPQVVLYSGVGFDDPTSARYLRAFNKCTSFDPIKICSVQLIGLDCVRVYQKPDCTGDVYVTNQTCCEDSCHLFYKPSGKLYRNLHDAYDPWRSAQPCDRPFEDYLYKWD